MTSSPLMPLRKRDAGFAASDVVESIKKIDEPEAEKERGCHWQKHLTFRSVEVPDEAKDPAESNKRRIEAEKRRKKEKSCEVNLDKRQIESTFQGDYASIVLHPAFTRPAHLCPHQKISTPSFSPGAAAPASGR